MAYVLDRVFQEAIFPDIIQDRSRQHHAGSYLIFMIKQAHGALKVYFAFTFLQVNQSY
jgi:hypothetical protein